MEKKDKQEALADIIDKQLLESHDENHTDARAIGAKPELAAPYGQDKTESLRAADIVADMQTEDAKQKLKRVHAAILDSVRMYWDIHDKPITLRILVRNFRVSLEKLGITAPGDYIKSQDEFRHCITARGKIVIFESHVYDQLKTNGDIVLYLDDSDHHAKGKVK